MERTRVPEGRQNVGDGPDWAKRLCRPSGTVDFPVPPTQHESAGLFSVVPPGKTAGKPPGTT